MWHTNIPKAVCLFTIFLPVLGRCRKIDANTDKEGITLEGVRSGHDQVRSYHLLFHLVQVSKMTAQTWLVEQNPPSISKQKKINKNENKAQFVHQYSSNNRQILTNNL